MFVESVSSEYDVDLLEDTKNITSKWNHHTVKQIDEKLSCEKALETPPREHSSMSGRWDIKPLMTKCSGSIKYEPETGAITITGTAEFDTGKKEPEPSHDNDAGKETTSNDVDPPDSRDRDHDKD